MYYINLVIDQKSRHTDELYTYASEEPVSVGQVVNVTFGKSKKIRKGFVFETGVTPEIGLSRIKTIESVDDTYSLPEEAVRTAMWMRSRYGIGYYDGLKCFLLPGKPPRPGKEKEPYRDTVAELQDIRELTDEQTQAVGVIFDAVETGEQKSFLLHGVTGSGKTEVYMQVIRKVLDLGKTAVMLVPEIALTKQVIDRFAGRFGKSRIAVLHSKLTLRERHDEWMRIRKGEATVVIGARIGVFAPVENLGVMILDEEHEATYKSDQTPKYDTVDIAMKRLMDSKGILILGSATPSVVSYQRCREGIYQLLEMKKRYNEVPLPAVELVDMLEELKSGNRSPFSHVLTEKIRKNLSDGQQVILFLNRRGYSTFVTCGNCGETMRCPECGISLVYHKKEQALICHYCGKRWPVTARCPSCGGETIRYLGIGTEQIEELTKEQFPDVVTDRLDLDTAKNSREINRILSGFSKGTTRILIGTQLVAKGLDFKNVGLVGVISADVSLNIPDYRSTERTFQLVSQVSGRAGRGDRRGEVVIQTFTPENFALLAAQEHSYTKFFEKEVMIRRFMNYPPFTDLIAAEFTAKEEDIAVNQAQRCKNYLAQAKLPDAEKVLGPRESYSFKGQDASRYLILVKCPRGERNRYIYYLRFFGDQMMQKDIDCVMTIDVNPYSTL